jgi:hypothetical protein
MQTIIIRIVLLTAVAGAHVTLTAEEAGIEIRADNFQCLHNMTRVRHFFVDNLLGELDATVAAANAHEGATYPPGSLVQLVPGEAMVKHHAGWNAATRDWEFFELEVSSEGTNIGKRGFADVINRFGGNCFACHVKARPEWDLICEQGHGCEPIPITREQIGQIQKDDPRCT